MISLSDSQLAIVTDVARMVPIERRDIFPATMWRHAENARAIHR
jgi:hypothetical protein